MFHILNLSSYYYDANNYWRHTIMTPIIIELLSMLSEILYQYYQLLLAQVSVSITLDHNRKMISHSYLHQNNNFLRYSKILCFSNGELVCIIIIKNAFKFNSTIAMLVQECVQTSTLHHINSVSQVHFADAPPRSYALSRQVSRVHCVDAPTLAASLPTALS